MEKFDLRGKLKRLARKHVCLIALSIGAGDYNRNWGITGALLGFHVGVLITPDHWLYVHVEMWPWGAHGRHWQFFRRAPGSKAFFEK